MHRGCTSAVEASISGKKFAMLSNFAIEKSGSIASIISTKIENLDSFRFWLNQKNNNRAEDSKNYDLLKEHINFSNKKASEKIAPDLSSLSGSEVLASDLDLKNPDIFKLKEFLYKLKGKIFKKIDYVPKLPKKNKMQDGIKLNECQYYLKIMYPDFSYNVDEPKKDLIKIEFNN